MNATRTPLRINAGPAIATGASTFDRTIFHRGTGFRTIYPSVRSSSSLPKQAVASAIVTIGKMAATIKTPRSAVVQLSMSSWDVVPPESVVSSSPGSDAASPESTVIDTFISAFGARDTTATDMRIGHGRQQQDYAEAPLPGELAQRKQKDRSHANPPPRS